MIKLILLSILLLTGCASMSEYERGCNDGLRRWTRGQMFPAVMPHPIDSFCASLEYENRAKKLERERPDRGGRR